MQVEDVATLRFTSNGNHLSDELGHILEMN